ncbi:MAG: methionyl-tRNA formyltransferase [Clostridiales Family XIII bacterium]|jgi:methionyl-tRNA formyltransferase|nr:methionyl-tRNA formyltransferase [Clostridiales Family XIII bacterium]
MSEPRVKIVYMGTPDFATPALVALNRAGWTVALAVTQPDRRSGRGRHVAFTPVKRCASALGIPVAQPDRIKGNAEFVNRMIDIAPDLIVVAAYGKILPREILEIPSMGCVNIHASLLPKYRGAAPIHRAVEAGERVTGVTLMYMAEDLDAGDVIASAAVDITGMNTGRVHDLLASLGADLLMDTLPAIIAGTAIGKPQDHAAATYASMVRKEEGHIDFAESADAVERKIRAMNPFPGAYAFLGGTRIKIMAAHVGTGGFSAPGTVLEASGAGIAVSAKDGVVVLDVLQAPGKKPLAASEYLKGACIDTTDVFR